MRVIFCVRKKNVYMSSPPFFLFSLKLTVKVNTLKNMALIPFKNPTTMTLSGCTGSGKTSWLVRLLKHKEEMFESEIKHIFYHYGT